MVNYKSVKIIINIPELAKVIINVIVQHHSLLNSIVTNRSSLFTLKLWLSLRYFFRIKRKLFIAFYPRIESQTKQQNSNMDFSKLSGSLNALVL